MTISIFGIGTAIESPLRDRKNLISLGGPLESEVNVQNSLVLRVRQSSGEPKPPGLDRLRHEV